jgi:hypothetical protein
LHGLQGSGLRETGVIKRPLTLPQQNNRCYRRRASKAWRAEPSIIAPAALFVKEKFEKFCTNLDPEICATFQLAFSIVK